MTTMHLSSHARHWGVLWGSRPADWAATEEQQTPVYEAALARAPVDLGDHVLDVGCGSGVFLRMCVDRGATASGIDAAAGLLDVARERVPEAALRHGDMQALPYPDDTFDLVTGFTSFFFAEDMVAAIREAGRVARPGAPIVIQVFGPPERCDLETVKGAVAEFRGEAHRSDWRPGVAEEIVQQAGLSLTESFDVAFHYRYANETAMLDAMSAAGGAALAAGREREHEVRTAIAEALARCRQPDGSYRLANEWHVVVARAE
ncbi:MAG TPA: class I SAM-dependent methyltransferase [Solirubrobacteraceae bacterium]|nr:class I SAM-dependent methyltransferase [Solirubrobacteraceae bacterium]